MFFLVISSLLGGSSAMRLDLLRHVNAIWVVLTCVMRLATGGTGTATGRWTGSDMSIQFDPKLPPEQYSTYYLLANLTR